MISVTALWLPVLLSAVIVFLASSVIHMTLPWHKGDFRKLDAEDDVLDALRRFELAPGDYVAPLPSSMAEAGSPEFKAKARRGPRIMLTVRDAGDSMARSLVVWFVYLLVVCVFAAYVAGLTLAAGTPYMAVFRVTSTVAFAGFSLAIWQSYIWYSRSIGYIVRSTIDGLVYALLTGGVFGWLWP
jgi:hypothetical protein